MRRLGGNSALPFTPLTFTGISQYSGDLNTVLQRAVSIASLPLKRLQNDDADVLSKKTALGSLTASVAAIEATSSNPSKVSVVYTGANSSATYTISDISSVAEAAAEASLSGYADSTT